MDFDKKSNNLRVYIVEFKNKKMKMTKLNTKLYNFRAIQTIINQGFHEKYTHVNIILSCGLYSQDKIQTWKILRE